MKNKIVLGLEVGVLALAVLAVFLYWQNDKLAVAERCAAGRSCQAVGLGNGVKMGIVALDQTDSFYNIQAEYPQIEGADMAFNAKIASTVNRMIDTFKKEARDNFDARNSTLPAGQPVLQKPEEPFDFVASWTPAQFGPKYASFEIDIYYFSGGAHGADHIFVFNYDLQNQKEITIGDFLGSQTNLDKLAKLSQDQVTAQLQSNGLQANDSLAQMIQDGTKATSDNYRNFIFGYGKLIIFFEQYQVAPGSVGSVTINIYKDDLERAGINTDFLN